MRKEIKFPSAFLIFLLIIFINHLIANLETSVILTILADGCKEKVIVDLDIESDSFNWIDWSDGADGFLIKKSEGWVGHDAFVDDCGELNSFWKLVDVG